MSRLSSGVVVALAGFCLFGSLENLMAIESAFPKTPVGEFEIKTLPAGTVILAKMSENARYFDNDNRLFRKLFGYIQKNKISMTVPVEAEIAPGSMVFWVGEKDLEKARESTPDVEVVEVAPRIVASFGVRGGYSEKNFAAAESKLRAWLKTRDDWKPDGDAKAVFWDGPFLPGFLKRFEVHIPVAKAEK